MSERKVEMLDYRKNDMLDELLQRYYITFSLTLDTIDFVGVKTDKKIHKYIFKNMKKNWRKIDKKYNDMIFKEWWDGIKKKLADNKQKRLEKRALRKKKKLLRKNKRKQKKAKKRSKTVN